MRFTMPAAFLGPWLFLLAFRGGRDGWRGRRRGALDTHFEDGHYVRVQPQFDILVAQGADGVFEVNLLLVERDVELRLELVGNRARG